MNELLLIVTIAGDRVAIRASEVQSVIEVGALTPVPQAPAHIAGLAALRSKAITVIDCQCSLGFTDQANLPASGSNPKAVVVEHGGHVYALLVDDVADVVHADNDPEQIHVSLRAGWERAGIGVVETAQGPLLLVNTQAIVAGPENKLAA